MGRLEELKSSESFRRHKRGGMPAAKNVNNSACAVEWKSPACREENPFRRN